MPSEESAEESHEIAVAVADVVSTWRLARGWSQEALADEAGLHRTYIGLVERGERRLSLGAAARLAAAFGIPLSQLVIAAEASLEGVPPVAFEPRQVRRDCLHGSDWLMKEVGLSADWVGDAIEAAYSTIDMIDERLVQMKSPPLSGLVELANLSSMLGNLLGAGLAQASQGRYERNRPHTYPDLVPQCADAPPLELKTALEKNKPKGHLPKPGLHITFRYVLGEHRGAFTPGKENRGTTVWVWEARVGWLTEADYSVSNTDGDSGKTAVIRTEAMDRMTLVYMNPDHSPYGPAGVRRRRTPATSAERMAIERAKRLRR